MVADVTKFKENGDEHRKIMDAYKELRFKDSLPN